MIKKALMAMDFSNPSLELFHNMPDLMDLGVKELLLVHVVKIKGMPEGVGTIKRRLLKLIEKDIQKAEEQGVKVELEVCMGTPSEEICRLVVKERCGLVVIGSSGEGSSVRTTLLGATAANVVRSCTVPVLLEKFVERDVESSNLRRKLETVLVPIDFSTCSEAVLKFIAGYNNLLKKVILVHVLDKPEDRVEMAEEEDRAKVKLEKWAKRIADMGPETKVVMGKGIASQTILAEAGESDVTLIALPRRGRGLVAGLIIGSTADAVVRRAAAPVLVFPF